MKLKTLLYLFSLALLFTNCTDMKDTSNGDNVRAASLSEKNSYTLVIHGGAGTILKSNMTAEKEKAYREKLKESLLAGHAILKKGGSSADAVEATIHIMEDSPLFNAGKGAVLTNAGHCEMDASFMDGKTLNAGAVAGATKIKHPISAARKVMDESVHVMLSGEGANSFAERQNLEMVPMEYFQTERRKEQLQRAKDLEKDKSMGEVNFLSEIEFKVGTVGAAALDQAGNLTAGTSTGGMTNKRYGRIGDSPIIGAGTYANNATCAVSATGHGEYFIRNVVCYDISAQMQYGGKSLADAADDIINKRLVEQKGSGGVIAVDNKGNVAMPFNTPGMYRGYIKSDGVPHIFIYKNE